MSEQRVLRLFLDAVQAVPHIVEAGANVNGHIEQLVLAIRGAQALNRPATESEWAQLQSAVRVLTNASGEARNRVLQADRTVNETDEEREAHQRRIEEPDSQPASGPDETSAPSNHEKA